MDKPPSAYVYGASLAISWADSSLSLTDLIFKGVSAALADAGMSISQADSVVLAAHDLIDGRSLSSMVTAPAAGAYLRDEIRLSEDGLAALSFAAARVEAGESEVSVVAAWGRASEGGFPWMSQSSMDPFTEQPFGIGEADISAFRLSRYLSEHGADPARMDALKARRARVEANPHALREPGGRLPSNYPLKEDERPPLADIVAAAIIGRAPGGIRVAGIGHGTDIAAIGARDLLALPALRTAAGTAMTQSNSRLDEIGVFEIDGMMLSDEVIALEALGLCPAGRGFGAYATDPRVNPSGGSGAGWCYPAMGLVRCVEAFRRLRDGATFAAGSRRLALATGNGAIGGQTTTAVILEAA
ncbi:hypothetical protein FHS85_004261 [Rhodoligotrophos appendicifer]|uniref:thiolase C-terminal domain-containing protein n=1 Tax=Rhodoligotrophos appendicifer TaxID=987056 RepID=UPI0014787ED3|nr:hypothetical protein [Rhodoligotrophos appendicifer]